MSGLELGADIAVEHPTDDTAVAEYEERERTAAISIADRIAARNPHPLDDVMPRIAGAVIARDPQVRAELVEILDAVFGDNPPRRKP
ncbi:hypothetical protein ACWCRC_37240 [Streptomyces sp. NPDC001940]